MKAVATSTEIEISGKPEDLKKIANGVLRLKDTKQFSIKLNKTSNPAPYNFSLENIHFQVAQGPVLVKIENKDLYICGGIAELNVLASFFDFEPNNNSDQHHHYEYFQGNDYVHKDSIPMVIKLNIN